MSRDQQTTATTISMLLMMMMMPTVLKQRARESMVEELSRSKVRQ
jgi:hypothetical protein